MTLRLVPMLACLVGAALVAVGLWACVAYVRAAMGDLSMAYWGLVIPMLGLALAGAGVALLALGRKAWHGDAGARSRGLRALMAVCVVATLVALAGHVRQRRLHAEMAALEQDARLHADRVEHARKPGPLDIGFDGRDALVVKATPTSGLDGRYRWTVIVSGDDSVLHASSRQLRLQGSPPPIVERLRFETLFAPCFTASPPKAYACVRNAEASGFYMVAVRLELVDDGPRSTPPSAQRGSPIATSRSATLRLDTRTSGHAVTVTGMGTQ